MNDVILIKCLLEAVPVPDPRRDRDQGIRLAGDIPSPVWKVGEAPERVRLVDIGGGHLVAHTGL